MNVYHRRRLFLIALFMISLAAAASFILYALRQNLNAFYTPSQALQTHLPAKYHFRLGGLVKPGSLHHESTGLGIYFIVSDWQHQLKVRYVGVPPDLFREGKGVIAEGYLINDTFIATQLLAKHDENYMPKKFEFASREHQPTKLNKASTEIRT